MALANRTPDIAPPAKTGTPCSVGAIYSTLASDPVELRELNVILYEEGNTQAQVFEYLTKAGGFKGLGFQTVNKHRGKQCRCFKEEPSPFCWECRRDLPSCVCGAA